MFKLNVIPEDRTTKEKEKFKVILTIAKPQNTKMQAITPHAEQKNRRMLNITDAENREENIHSQNQIPNRINFQENDPTLLNNH